jgi:hypothetical protein
VGQELGLAYRAHGSHDCVPFSYVHLHFGTIEVQNNFGKEISKQNPM